MTSVNSEASQLHFTYRCPDDKDLHQGDILQKNEEINGVLEQVHPHYYRSEDYSHLMVITQTCDLVRRNQNICKTPYITVVAVRSLETVLQRELVKFQRSFLETEGNICSLTAREKLKSFIVNLLNNNNQEYFYLHPEHQLNFFDPSCAFLRLPISLRAKDHYDKCIRARKMSLNENFRAKLGHHVGTIYSRVGTDDFVPFGMSKEDFENHTKYILDTLCEWVEDEKLKVLKKEIKSEEAILNDGIERIRDWVRQKQLPSKKEEVVDRVLIVLKQCLSEDQINDQKEKQIKNLLKSDPLISKYVK